MESSVLDIYDNNEACVVLVSQGVNVHVLGQQYRFVVI